MAILSTKTLKAFPFSKFADPKTIQRGSAYYTEGRVLDYEFPNPGKAVCTVDGDMDMYTVEVEAGDRQGDLNFFCDCPYAVDHFCKHMVAAGLALIEHFEEIEEDAGDEEPDEGGSGKRPIPPSDQWRKSLDQVFQQLPSPVSSGGKPQPYAAALLMEKSTYAYQNSYTLTPFVVKAKDWQDLNNLADADRATIQDLLQKDREWPFQLCRSLDIASSGLFCSSWG